jgi:high-affinity Fe2+/Pb2+ permease
VLGYDASPFVVLVIAYTAYLAGALALFFMGRRPPPLMAPRPQQETAA